MLKSVKTLSTAEFGKMVDFAVDTGTNLLVLGASGIGKTEIPRTRCTKNGHPVVYWNLSTKEATDLVGQTMIDKATMRTVYAPPADIPTDFVDADGNEIPGAVIVIDELDKCEKELQNPLLEVLDQNLRSLAGRKLNIKAVIATGNLPDEHAFAKPISHALANRCSLYRIEANLEEWVADFAIPSGISPLIIGFLTQDGAELFCEKASHDPNDHLRGSPRSWTDAARKLEFRQKMVKGETTDEEIRFQTTIIGGCVGETAALKFQIWLEHYREIRPIVDAILNGKKLSDRERDRLRSNTQAEMVVGFTIFGEFNRLVRGAAAKQIDREELFRKVTAGSQFMLDRNNMSPSTLFASVKGSLTDVKLYAQTQTVSIPSFMDICRLLNKEVANVDFNER